MPLHQGREHFASWYHLVSPGPHGRGLGAYRRIRYACAMTGAPVAALCTPVHSVRGSETMFSAAFHTPSHQPGLSVTYLRTYSSLHCLCQRYSIVSGLHLVYPGEAALSMVHLIKMAGLTKRGLCQTRQFLYIAPGMCRSFLIFFPASLSPRFFPLGVMRLSRRTAMRVPTDWKICTSTTRTMTAT